ncbi:hypothetical protein NPX13_g413 [Xylaria arbuscula]|uniref:Uncharacterized protein n=1 Tax=Xylaria arbuscula TaxID=114810 RepID=A0A9W8TS24_9PEZI|nr:hypothetical protein NPX13_g413 [Xylaria arbuscula]
MSDVLIRKPPGFTGLGAGRNTVRGRDYDQGLPARVHCAKLGDRDQRAGNEVRAILGVRLGDMAKRSAKHCALDQGLTCRFPFTYCRGPDYGVSDTSAEEGRIAGDGC